MTIKHTSQDKILSEASQYFEHILFERNLLIKNLSTIHSNYKVMSIREIMEYDLQLDATYEKCRSYPDNECHLPPFSDWNRYFNDYFSDIKNEFKKEGAFSDEFIIELDKKFKFKNSQSISFNHKRLTVKFNGENHVLDNKRQFFVLQLLHQQYINDIPYLTTDEIFKELGDSLEGFEDASENKVSHLFRGKFAKNTLAKLIKTVSKGKYSINL